MFPRPHCPSIFFAQSFFCDQQEFLIFSSAFAVYLEANWKRLFTDGIYNVERLRKKQYFLMAMLSEEVPLPPQELSLDEQFIILMSLSFSWFPSPALGFTNNGENPELTLDVDLKMY